MFENLGCNETGFTNANEAYFPLTNTWVVFAPMPTARTQLASCVVNNILYAIGGYDGGANGLNITEAYTFVPTTTAASTTPFTGTTKTGQTTTATKTTTNTGSTTTNPSGTTNTGATTTNPSGTTNTGSTNTVSTTGTGSTSYSKGTVTTIVTVTAKTTKTISVSSQMTIPVFLSVFIGLFMIAMI